MTTLEQETAARLNVVQEHIVQACDKSGRSPDEITLVAVSKVKPVLALQAAIAAGVQHFGESRVEEVQAKQPEISAEITWHMIGHIQSRKARHVPGLFDVIHSVDSVKLAKKLAQNVEPGYTKRALLQINISGEESKYGLAAENWDSDATMRDNLWREVQTILALPQLQITGLMTIAPLVEDAEQVRPVFTNLARLRAALSESFEVPLPELSMGMTDDYMIAIEEGATIVRIGRAIFGERNI